MTITSTFLAATLLPRMRARYDYSEYRDIYVGKSLSMGRSVYDDVSGKGDVDVYADVKYKQDVYVLLFPCREDKLDQLKGSLVVALDADASYNAPPPTTSR